MLTFALTLLPKHQAEAITTGSSGNRTAKAPENSGLIDWRDWIFGVYAYIYNCNNQSSSISTTICFSCTLWKLPNTQARMMSAGQWQLSLSLSTGFQDIAVGDKRCYFLASTKRTTFWTFDSTKILCISNRIVLVVAEKLKCTVWQISSYLNPMECIIIYTHISAYHWYHNTWYVYVHITARSYPFMILGQNAWPLSAMWTTNGQSKAFLIHTTAHGRNQEAGRAVGTSQKSQSLGEHEKLSWEQMPSVNTS